MGANARLPGTDRAIPESTRPGVRIRFHRNPLPRNLLAPFGSFLGILGLYLSVLLTACYRPIDGRDTFSDRASAEKSDRPQDIDSRRFALIRVGMPEPQVLEILGPPFESRGPQLQPIRVPGVLNPEDCDNQIPCVCTGPVRELFYYRGDFGESFYVYIDSAGAVCCYQRTHAFRMSLTAI